MKSAILCSGEINDYEYIKKLCQDIELLICADGGSLHAYNMGLMPQVIIGDLDSSDDKVVEYFRALDVNIIEYNSDKDKTDTQLCIEYAAKTSKDIMLLGATGSRMDHTIANLSLLYYGLERGLKVSIANDKNLIFMIKDNITIKGSVGDIVSLLPYTEKVEGIRTSGLHYELAEAVMKQGAPYGVSNYLSREEAFIEIGNGYLLVILSKD